MQKIVINEASGNTNAAAALRIYKGMKQQSSFKMLWFSLKADLQSKLFIFYVLRVSIAVCNPRFM